MEPLVFPTGTEVYDALMGAIDPELLSANLEHLDDAYASETQEARKVRYERYSDAFAKYDQAFAVWQTELQKTVHAYRRTAMQSAEADSKVQDEESLTVLEQDIESVSSPSAV